MAGAVFKSENMNSRKKTIFIFIWAFLLGALSMHFVDRLLLKTEFSLHKTSVTQGQDPFEQMQQLQQQMLKQFGHFDESEQEGNLWDLLRSQGLQSFSLNMGELKTHEDDGFVYYEIDTKGLEQKNFSIQVEQGHVIIDGVLEGPGQNSNARISSKFHQSFPLPENVDANNIQLENDKDKIVIKLPKIKN